MFMRYVLLLTFLLSTVTAVPLALRDVVDPPITSPTATTVWHVGETQTVTWNTTGLPVNQTNPVGMLVLGYLYNNSENLMLDSPLATNLSYPVGQAQITVPNVPTRSNYIVVLFGDSGNASPEFTIINDASSPSSTTSADPPDSSSSAAIHASTHSAATGANPPSTLGSSPTAGPSVLSTAMAPSSQGSSNISTTVTATSSKSPSPTQSNAAWQLGSPSLSTSLSVVLIATYFVFL